jgi:hypothetical protein
MEQAVLSDPRFLHWAPSQNFPYGEAAAPRLSTLAILLH